MIRPSVECWLLRHHPEEPRVLLLHASARPGVRPELWSPVTGGIEPGESPEQGCLREVQEESGLMLPEAALVGVVDGLALVVDPDRTLLKHVFAAVAPDGEVRCDPAEHDRAEWVARSAVHDRLVRESHRATWALAQEAVDALMGPAG